LITPADTRYSLNSIGIRITQPKKGGRKRERDQGGRRKILEVVKNQSMAEKGELETVLGNGKGLELGQLWAV